MTNMTIWDQLSVTDPKHTKDFQRAGGFRGTAIKPMYAIQKMTEVFGTCGTGWGYTKPEYQIVDGTDGQKIVYCTVGLWHGETESFVGSDNYVWGVGGDFIIVKQSAGLRSDDEAFKKAFTDALMNAMKHIGMSADVHMGQFDASKYVQPKQDEAVRGGTTAADLSKDWPPVARKKAVDDLMAKLLVVEASKLTEAKTYTNKMIKNLNFVGDTELAIELGIALEAAIQNVKDNQ